MQECFEFCRDLPARPKRPKRLFFGLLPDPETARRIERFAEGFVRMRRLSGTPVRRARLHVSLHHVGDFPRLRPRFLFAAERAARAVTMPPFQVTFRRMGSFDRPPGPGGIPLVLFGEGAALPALYGALGEAMAASGMRPGRTFAPHMTLLYATSAVVTEPVEPIRLAVGEFALIHSELGLGRYNVVGRWPLDG